jgi:hypothetical protein
MGNELTFVGFEEEKELLCEVEGENDGDPLGDPLGDPVGLPVGFNASD